MLHVEKPLPTQHNNTQQHTTTHIVAQVGQDFPNNNKIFTAFLKIKHELDIHLAPFLNKPTQIFLMTIK